MTSRPLLLVGLLAAGCATEPAPAPAAPAPAAPAIDCGAAVPGAAPLLQAGRVVIFGEVHGTQEAPAMFARVICASAAQAQPTVVALEMPPGEQAALDAFFAAERDDDATATLLRSRHWIDQWPDGRDSVAMLDLLRQLRGWRRAGAPIEVFAFDVPAETEPTIRDQVMAARLAMIATTHRDALTLVLTGNYHSRKQPVPRGDSTFEPMAFWLTRFGVEPTTLNLRYRGGTAWVCDMDNVCGAAEMGGLEQDGEPGIQLVPGVEGHDGFYLVGTITASPPAAEPASPRP